MILTELIRLYDPTAEFCLTKEEDIRTLTWISGSKPRPKLADLEEFKPALNKFYEGRQLLRDRRRAYGDIGEQLDMLYKDMMNGTTTWMDHITAVKTEYPKSE